MPIFLLPMLIKAIGFLGQCKVCRAVLIGLAALAALWTFVTYEKHKAVAAYVAVQEKLTAVESGRRQGVIAAAQAKADAAAAQAATMEKRNATLKSEISRLSRRNDKRPCLDADSVRRLTEVGQPPSR